MIVEMGKNVATALPASLVADPQIGRIVAGRLGGMKRWRILVLMIRRVTGGLRALRHPPGGVKGADGMFHVVSVQKTIRTFRTFQHRLGLRHRPKLALSLDVPRVKSPPFAQVQVDRAPVADSVLAFVVQFVVHTRANVFVTVVIANLACVA